MALRQTILRTLSGLGALVTVGAFANSPAHAEVSVRIVCTTPDASLAFHAGGDAQQGAPDISTTSQLPGTYEPALRNDLIANHDMEMFEFDIISGDDMMRRFGYDACR